MSCGHGGSDIEQLFRQGLLGCRPLTVVIRAHVVIAALAREHSCWGSQQSCQDQHCRKAHHLCRTQACSLSGQGDAQREWLPWWWRRRQRSATKLPTTPAKHGAMPRGGQLQHVSNRKLDAEARAGSAAGPAAKFHRDSVTETHRQGIRQFQSAGDRLGGVGWLQSGSWLQRGGNEICPKGQRAQRQWRSAVSHRAPWDDGWTGRAGQNTSNQMCVEEHSSEVCEKEKRMYALIKLNG